MSVEWRMLREPDSTYDSGLLDCRIKDAYNRFAREATAILDDPDGTKRTLYPKATPVQFEFKRDIDSSYTTRFGGFVFGDKTDRDTLELDILAHDLWLRKREIFASYTDTAISAILKDLIETYTPLTWDASLVNVENDISITRQWKGEVLSEVIGELSSRSGDEEFGGHDDAKFFFRQPETNTSPRHFEAGDYYEADFDESGAAEVNKVLLYYGEGSNTAGIAVQDRESQRQLQTDLNAPRPVVIEKTANYPEIANEDTAEAKARAILNGNTSIRTGNLRTWEAFSTRPGDIARTVVPDQNVDGDYRVAAIEYQWANDETNVTLAKNSEGVIDVLSSLSETVTRIDAKQADSDATVNEVVDLLAEIVVDTEIEVYTRSVPDDQFLFGDWKGGLGDPDKGGGKLGDQRGDATKVV